MLKLKLFHNNVVILSKGLLKRFLKLNCIFKSMHSGSLVNGYTLLPSCLLLPYMCIYNTPKKNSFV